MTTSQLVANTDNTDKSATALRSMGAGLVGPEQVGREVRVAGWVHRRRNLGGLVFLDLRDRWGVLQASVGPEWSSPQAVEAARGLGAEDVVALQGVVARRPPEARNPEMATGDVELQVADLRVVNRAETPAIPVYRSPEEELPSEELRLRHRVLDLRRAEMRERLELRHRLVLAVRNYFDAQGFVEIETPVLTRPTPEGARDFLVPSRVHPGEFFALPQSPQIYKQVLMAAGFDRYFQIARCFRDEDLRADRQPEFTQIDVEASFVEPVDVYRWCEGMAVEVARAADAVAEPPFPRLEWSEAMERFGSDRPDLRWGLEIEDMTATLGALEFRVLRSAVEAGGRVRGIRAPGGARLSRRQIAAVEDAAKAAGAPGLLWAKVQDGGAASGPLGRFFQDGTSERLALAPGDLLLTAAGDDATTSPALSATRSASIAALDPPRRTDHAWLWVSDFPVFEARTSGQPEAEAQPGTSGQPETSGQPGTGTQPGTSGQPGTGAEAVGPTGAALAASHHPFVQPNPEDVHLLDSEPLAVRGLAYDLVYNGTELGSGSIRIHDADLQRRVLTLLGLAPSEIEAKFGFLLEALRSGAPPHGGIALGVDRIAARLSGAASLRDVVAFPKTTAARALFEGAPAPAPADEVAALGISLSRVGHRQGNRARARQVAREAAGGGAP